MKTALHYILLAISSSVASAKLGGSSTSSSVRGLVVADPLMECKTCLDATTTCYVDGHLAATCGCVDCAVDDTFTCDLEAALDPAIITKVYATTDGESRAECTLNASEDGVDCTYTQCVRSPTGIVCEEECDASGERQCKARDDSGTVLDPTITCECADCPSDPTFTCTGDFTSYTSALLKYGIKYEPIGECTVSADKTELHCTEKCVTGSPTKAPTTAPTTAPTKAPTCNQAPCGDNVLCACGEVCNETREKVQGQGWVIEKTCGPDCNGVCDGINQVACNEESDCCNWSDKGQGKCQYK